MFPTFLRVCQNRSDFRPAMEIRNRNRKHRAISVHSPDPPILVVVFLSFFFFDFLVFFFSDFPCFLGAFGHCFFQVFSLAFFSLKKKAMVGGTGPRGLKDSLGATSFGKRAALAETESMAIFARMDTAKSTGSCGMKPYSCLTLLCYSAASRWISL